MRRRSVLLGMLGLVGVFASAPGGSATVGSSVPATLYSNADASVLSVSCGSAGNCVAGGYYVDGFAYSRQAFVVSETNGIWGLPIEVPGTAALNRGRNAMVESVSCAAAGDCVAGGWYTDGTGNSQSFLASETNGVWGNAIRVPGTATLLSSIVDSVSCAAAGECAAGGLYVDGSDVPAFVVSETNGVWGTAIEVPGTATVNTEEFIQGTPVSCAAAGDCAAGGQYTDGSGHRQAYVVSEQSGVWGDAIEVPGTAALNSGGDAGVESVSCGAAGDCVAGGYYRDGSGAAQAFVAAETNGVWGDAIEVPGAGTLNSGGDAGVSSVSCAAAGDCSAGGSFTDGSGHTQAFVVTQTSGVWGDAIEVPGTTTLNSGGNADVVSVSCAAAGDCSAGGSYTDGYGHVQAFVVTETSGVWGDAIEVPGTAALNSGGGAGVLSVSCAVAGDCTAGGVYTGSSGHKRAFVVGETGGSWSNASAVPKFPVFCLVPKVVGKFVRFAKPKIVFANCTVGTITKVYSKARRGLVLAQRPKPGTRLKRGAKVALTVSEGPRP